VGFKVIAVTKNLYGYENKCVISKERVLAEEVQSMKR